MQMSEDMGIIELTRWSVCVSVCLCVCVCVCKGVIFQACAQVPSGTHPPEKTIIFFLDLFIFIFHQNKFYFYLEI